MAYAGPILNKESIMLDFDAFKIALDDSDDISNFNITFADAFEMRWKHQELFFQYEAYLNKLIQREEHKLILAEFGLTEIDIFEDFDKEIENTIEKERFEYV